MDAGPFKLVFLVLVIIVAASRTQEVTRYHSSDSLVKHLAVDIQQIKKKVSEVLQQLKLEKGSTKSCPDWFTTRHQSSCYHFVPANVDWMTAYIRCRMSGAQLVSIETQEENAYLINYIKKTPHLRAGNFWTSGTDHAEEGAWVWASNGKYLVYSDWHTGEPNGGTSQNCLLLYKPTGWNWHNGACSHKWGYICEISTY